MRKEKSMNNIDFEQDQREDLNSVNEAKSLSDQVVKLRTLEDELALKEKELEIIFHKQKKQPKKVAFLYYKIKSLS